MIIQIVKFESELSHHELLTVAESRIEQFRAMPGLIQKYYTKLDQSGYYAGVYVWDSIESMQAFRETDIAKSIPTVYKVKGQPSIEVMNCLFPLRD